MSENLEPIDILDVLLDNDNTAPIVLIDDHGRRIEFEQVAVIPYTVDEEKRVYCILKPITALQGIASDEAVVFYVAFDENDNSFLKVEQNEDIARAIFDEYVKLLTDDN